MMLEQAEPRTVDVIGRHRAWNVIDSSRQFHSVNPGTAFKKIIEPAGSKSYLFVSA
jgi:hypothetical protein